MIWDKPKKMITGASYLAEQKKHQDDFIRLASHELKTPITTLKGYIQILYQEPDQLNPKHLQYILKMDQQVNRLTQLINNLLDVSYLNSNKIELKKEYFDIDQFLKEIVSQMQSQIGNHTTLVDSKLKQKIYADKYRIGQVLINLLSNAVKYSPRANKIIIKGNSNGRNLIISVQDFGIGLFEKDKTKIFERFYQVQNRIRESFSGLGLGLYISKEIIKKHHGRIWVKSVKGQGSTFFFQIPKSKIKQD